MRYTDAEALKGKIVTLDMLGGFKITTKVTALERDPITNCHFLTCSQPAVIVLQETGPGKFSLAGVLPYGIPEFPPQKVAYLDISHIIMGFPSAPALADAYTKAVSSIVPVAANTPLPDMDALGAMMKKVQGS